MKDSSNRMLVTDNLKETPVNEELRTDKQTAFAREYCMDHNGAQLGYGVSKRRDC